MPRSRLLALAVAAVIGLVRPATLAAQGRVMTDCYMTLVGGHAIAVLNAHGPGQCTFTRVRFCAGDRIINTVKSTSKPIQITDIRSPKVETCDLKGH